MNKEMLILGTTSLAMLLRVLLDLDDMQAFFLLIILPAVGLIVNHLATADR